MTSRPDQVSLRCPLLQQRQGSLLFQLPAAHSLSAGASSLGERSDFAVNVLTNDNVFNDPVHNACIALCIWSLWHGCYYVTFLILTEMMYILSSKNDHDFYKRVVDPNFGPKRWA
jgi:hypothetical protein